MKKPTINLVNYEQGIIENGILTKHAREMEKNLIDMGYEVTVKNKPDPKADINHHINYIAAKDCPTLNTTMVTHFTSDMYKMDEKLDKMRKFLDKGGIGICFSQGIVDYLVKEGMPKEKLKVVLPAHDSMPRRSRIIALAYKIYPDKRKREYMLDNLVKSLKDKNKFTFRIMGPGWRETLDPLVKEGIRVQWVENFRRDFYEELLNTSDYLLYTGGEDAIAQCIVDAKNAGLRIIAPRQADVEVDIPFKTQAELNAIFKKLAENPVEDWTWENYTKKHVKIWEKMLKK